MPNIISDVICNFCGTLCDDLEVELSDGGRKIFEVYTTMCQTRTYSRSMLHSEVGEK